MRDNTQPVRAADDLTAVPLPARADPARRQDRPHEAVDGPVGTEPDRTSDADDARGALSDKIVPVPAQATHPVAAEHATAVTRDDITAPPAANRHPLADTPDDAASTDTADRRTDPTNTSQDEVAAAEPDDITASPAASAPANDELTAAHGADLFFESSTPIELVTGRAPTNDNTDSMRALDTSQTSDRNISRDGDQAPDERLDIQPIADHPDLASDPAGHVPVWFGDDRQFQGMAEQGSGVVDSTSEMFDDGDHFSTFGGE